MHLRAPPAAPDCQPALSPAADRADQAIHRSLSELIALLGGVPDEAGDGGIVVALRQVQEGSTLLLEGSQSSCLYIVRSGSLKSQRTLEDGHEQVLALAQTGELLGAEALHAGVLSASVFALEDSTVYVLPVRDLPALRRRDSQLDLALQMALSRQLVRAAETTAMTAAVASEVRLARFLTWLSGRMEEIGQSPSRLLLRMGRRDIASLLCMAHETVSRAFTTLSDLGLLRVDRRHVELIDLSLLRKVALCTRGLPQNAARALPAVGPHARTSAWCPAMAPLVPIAA